MGRHRSAKRFHLVHPDVSRVDPRTGHACPAAKYLNRSATTRVFSAPCRKWLLGSVPRMEKHWELDGVGKSKHLPFKSPNKPAPSGMPNKTKTNSRSKKAAKKKKTSGLWPGEAKTETFGSSLFFLPTRTLVPRNAREQAPGPAFS